MSSVVRIITYNDETSFRILYKAVALLSKCEGFGITKGIVWVNGMSMRISSRQIVVSIINPSFFSEKAIGKFIKHIIEDEEVWVEGEYFPKGVSSRTERLKAKEHTVCWRSV